MSQQRDFTQERWQKAEDSSVMWVAMLSPSWLIITLLGRGSGPRYGLVAFPFSIVSKATCTHMTYVHD